jgi:hypothetical protein
MGSVRLRAHKELWVFAVSGRIACKSKPGDRVSHERLTGHSPYTHHTLAMDNIYAPGGASSLRLPIAG